MDVVNSWISSLTKPAVQTLAAEVPRTSQSRIILSVGLATVLSAILGLLTGIFTHGGILGGFVGAIIGTPVEFFLGVGVMYIGARLMKGTGTFEQQAWVQSTFWAPLLILQGLHIPLLSGLISLAIAVYGLYQMYLMMQAVHRLDSSNSAIAMLIGVGIAMAVGLVLLAIALPFAFVGAIFFG